MKLKLFYFWREHKPKIMLAALFISFVLFAYFIYQLLFPKSEEIMIFSKNEEEIITSEEESEQTLSKYYVDIKGEVRTPGVYVLEEGKRVIDVIEEAGGLTKYADTSVNNLSRKIQDEMVIIIYSKTQVEDFVKTKEEEETLLEEIEDVDKENDAILKEEEIEPNVNQSESTSSNDAVTENTNTKISINNATKEELMTLTGIGSSKADAIIAYRMEHGKFTSIEQLLNVSGIGNAIFNQIKDFIEL